MPSRVRCAVCSTTTSPGTPWGVRHCGRRGRSPGTGAPTSFTPHWGKPRVSANCALLDRQEPLEADPLHDRHDVGEPGASQQAEVSFRREWFEHALEA